MGLSRCATVLRAAALVVGAAWLAACTSTQGDRDDRRAFERAERQWPAWAETELGAGAADSALLTASGRLRRNDWGVAPSFESELRFRPDRPTTPEEVVRALRRTCAFAPARDLTSHSVTALLATGTEDALVPTEVTTDCADGFVRVVSWLTHLEAQRIPPEVRGIEVRVQSDELLDHERDRTTLFVRTSDAARGVARRVSRFYCAYAGHPDLVLDLRSSTRPSAVGAPSLSSDVLPVRPCRP